MDLPSHVLYTYAVEKIIKPEYISNNPSFVFGSLVSSALPDIIESTPFLVYLYINRDKYGLSDIKSVINYASDMTHNKPGEYEKYFPWAAQISFYTHSYLIYMFVSVFLYLFLNFLFLPFVIGYGLHLFADMFVHNDYFSSRPFYPISNLSIPGFFTWYKNKKFTFWNYGILFILYIIIFLFVS